MADRARVDQPCQWESVFSVVCGGLSDSGASAGAEARSGVVLTGQTFRPSIQDLYMFEFLM